MRRSGARGRLAWHQAMLCALVLGVLWGAAAMAQTPTPTPPPEGDCCTEHDTAGCSNSACQACVCGLDSLCCSQPWDEFCVGQASDGCLAECGCDPPPTPTPGGPCCLDHEGPSCDDQACEACVCDKDPLCCTNLWDSTCVLEATVDCAGSCACGVADDCCEGHDTPGCSSESCQDCICEIDAACCAQAWDERCAEEAAVECAIECPCVTPGSCCEAHDGVSCDDLVCKTCVCELDDACCTIGWDTQCAEEAANECADSCIACTPGACCAAQTGAGCAARPGCEACVCEVDEFCCAEGWDGNCGDIAVDTCGAECACAAPCAGDCNDNGQVSVNELIVGVNIALDNTPIANCPSFDSNDNGDVGVNELILAVVAALNGCP